MLNKSNLKSKLIAGEYVIGTWCELPSPEVINVIAKAGLDFVIIDMEHGSMDFKLASNMVLAAEVEGCAPLIRVSRNDESDILRALEIAPAGIIVPHIESVAERVNAIKNIKFAPLGNRSLNPYTRAGGYRSTPYFTQEQNTKIFSGLIIEGEQGINALEEIIEDDNIDMIYVGTYDLSVKLGVPGDTKNVIVVDTLKKLVSTMRKKGKVVGCMFHDEKEFEFFKKIGIQFLCYRVDTAILFDEFQRVNNFKKSL